jgi:hypothetical protein
VKHLVSRISADKKGSEMRVKNVAVCSVREGYDAANLECASIIAADPVKYQGLVQEWADAILSKAADVPDSEAGPLFAQGAA